MNSEFQMPQLGKAEPSSPVTGYHRLTRTATYGFLMALPLVLLYEILIRWINRGYEGGGVRISSEVWMKSVPMGTPIGQWLQAKLLAYGITAEVGLLAVIVLVGLAIFLLERRKQLTLKASYGLGIVGESAVYALIVAYVVSFATYSVLQPGLGMVAQEAGELGLFQKLVMSLGAGIYEELLFRVLLTGGLFLVLNRIMPRVGAYLIAAVVGALLFSWIHYTGSLGDEFTMASFTFRALFGLVLNAIYLLRGFGVAAWTHAIYDVYVVTGVFSLVG